MAKLTLQADESQLKKKLAGKQTGPSEGDAAARALRKHLKRVQRKRRRLALRKHHAQGKQGGASAQPAAAGA